MIRWMQFITDNAQLLLGIDRRDLEVVRRVRDECAPPRAGGHPHADVALVG